MRLCSQITSGNLVKRIDTQLLLVTPIHNDLKVCGQNVPALLDIGVLIKCKLLGYTMGKHQLLFDSCLPSH